MDQTREGLLEELRGQAKELDKDIKHQKELNTYTIFSCIVGSKAYGLGTDKSDTDRRGIYIPPTDRVLSIRGVPEQTQGDNEMLYELGKFIRLGLKATPDALEMLYSPIVERKEEIGERLLELRDCFISKLCKKTYGGYAHQQLVKAKSLHKQGSKLNPKNMMHCIRLLYSGIELFKTGSVLVNVGDHREELLNIKDGKIPLAEIEAKYIELEKEFMEAAEKSDIKDTPDEQKINEFLIWARRKML